MIEKTNIQVDIQALIADYYKNINHWPVHENRICLNNHSGIDDYDKNASSRLIYTEYRYTNTIFKNSIWEETLKLIPSKLGRARIMLMNPQTSLSRHRDLETRWQLALITDPRCTVHDFDEDKSYHIPSDGYFYKLDARKPHAAYNNTDDLVRVNLVVAEYV